MIHVSGTKYSHGEENGPSLVVKPSNKKKPVLTESYGKNLTLCQAGPYKVKKILCGSEAQEGERGRSIVKLVVESIRKEKP